MLLTGQKGFCRCSKVELLKYHRLFKWVQYHCVNPYKLREFSSWKPERSSKEKQRDSKYEEDSTYWCWFWRWKMPQIRKHEQPLESEYSQSTVSKEMETQAYNCMELNPPPTWMHLKVSLPLSLQLRAQAGQQLETGAGKPVTSLRLLTYRTVIINTCCFKPLGFLSFAATIEN